MAVRRWQPESGDDETSLDVEQSGGLAPDAKIRVYIAPNTNGGFLDLFYTAASENVADTVSISWGEAEEFYFASFNGGVDYTDQLQMRSIRRCSRVPLRASRSSPPRAIPALTTSIIPQVPPAFCPGAERRLAGQ